MKPLARRTDRVRVIVRDLEAGAREDRAALGLARFAVQRTPLSVASLADSLSVRFDFLTPPRLPAPEILRLLHEDGWFLVASRGSHRQFKHASKLGRVTVPGKPSDDLAPGTLNSVLKQSGLKR